jgi:hypothetical protein
MFAALGVAIAAVVLTLPPLPVALSPSSDGTIAGNLHVHSLRSDGQGTPDDIAAAAARAGLQFIILTDHGDATRVPDPPAYRSGVLCLDGVEISTTGGHYAVLGMPAAPYPLAGEPRDVVEDVRRLGGFGIAAHPDSPKPGLRWRDWTVPFDAVEWINQDTSWRVHATGGWRARLQLLASLLHYPVRPRETLARLLTTSGETMRRWSALADERRVVILSGTDAHAKIPPLSLPLPSYDASFSTFSVHVKTDRPLSGEAAADAALVVGAIREGHLYTAVDGDATPPSFDFTATSGHDDAHEGDELRADGPVVLRIRSNAPPGFATTIWRGTAVLASHYGNEWSVRVEGTPAVYRVEITAEGRDAPRLWILSNPIYVRGEGSRLAAHSHERPEAVASLPILDNQEVGSAHVEADRGSSGTLERVGTTGASGLSFRFRLTRQPTGSRTAALVWGLRPGLLASYDRLTFTARADRPMRVSIQLRAPGADGQDWRRWQQSVYLDTSMATHTLYFDELTPAPETEATHVPLPEINALMVVVDGTHTMPGATGQIWIDGPILQK